MDQKENGVFPALTGLRALAAFLVFFFHYNPFARFGKDSLAFKIVNEGHIGVSIFFVLSGFLIFHRYHATEKPLAHYFFNRFVRIFPLYLLVCGLQLLSPWYKFSGPIWKEVLLNLSLLKGLSDKYCYSGIPQSWSLTVEEMFYLLAPIFFFLIRKSIWWFLLSPIAILLLGFCFQELVGFFQIKTFSISPRFFWINTFFGRCFEFFWGMILAYSLPRLNPKAFSGLFTLAGFVVLLISLLSLVWLKGNLNYGLFQPSGIFINHMLMPLFGILPLIYGLIFEKTWFQKLLNSSLMQLLGKSSYAFYLIHIGFIPDFFTNTFRTNGLFIFIIIVFFSVLTYKWIEKPTYDFLKKP